MDEREHQVFERFANRTVRWLKILSVITVLCAAGFGTQLKASNDRADEAKHLAQQNRVLALQIQSERKRNVLVSCLDVNMRHNTTVRDLDRLIARYPQDRRESIKAGRFFTVYLIDRVVPVRDCPRYAAEQVRANP